MKKEVWRVVDLVMVPAGFAFVLIFTFMVAGAAAGQRAMGLRQEVKK